MQTGDYVAFLQSITYDLYYNCIDITGGGKLQ